MKYFLGSVAPKGLRIVPTLGFAITSLLMLIVNNVCAKDTRLNTQQRGAKVYAETCADCHSGTTYGPDLAKLTNMSAEDIYRELWYGVMAQFVNGMEDADNFQGADCCSDAAAEPGSPCSTYMEGLGWSAGALRKDGTVAGAIQYWQQYPGFC